MLFTIRLPCPNLCLIFRICLTFGHEFGQKKWKPSILEKARNHIQGKEGFHEQVYSAFTIYAGSV